MKFGKRRKKVDTIPQGGVESPQTSAPEPEPQPPARPAEDRKMELTYVGLSKNQKRANYSGIKGGLSIPLSKFTGGTAPASFTVSDVFNVPAAKLTAEERKAARAAAPKPTLAEKIAKREAALERLRAKAAAGDQPSL